jgi:hypothetical protein
MKKNNMFNTPDSVDQIPALIKNVIKFIEAPKGDTVEAIVSIMMINNFIADNYNDCDDCAFIKKETDGMVGVCPECDGTNLSTYESRVNKDTQ